MTNALYTVRFWPSHAQFVIYDVQTPYDREMVPHFNGPDDKTHSARRLELSIALLEDCDVLITLSTHTHAPALIDGVWAVTADVVLEVPSGHLGIRCVVDDLTDPELSVEIGAGTFRVRYFGKFDGSRSDERTKDGLNVFAVQIWPA
jgi:hypothetical protein